MPYYPLRQNFYHPSTDRDRAIQKLYHESGNLWEAPPSDRAVEARKYLDKLLAEGILLVFQESERNFNNKKKRSFFVLFCLRLGCA